MECLLGFSTWCTLKDSGYNTEKILHIQKDTDVSEILSTIRQEESVYIKGGVNSIGHSDATSSSLQAYQVKSRGQGMPDRSTLS